MSSVSQDVIVRSRLSAATWVPLLLLVIGAAAVFVQVIRIRSASIWVEHSEEAVVRCADLERRAREQNSAVLRRLLGVDTREQELSAQTRSLEAMNALERHLADNEGQLDQVRELRSFYNAWLMFAAKLGNGMPGGERPTLVDVEQLKSVFDSVIGALTAVEREERRLRSERAGGLRSAIDVTVYGAVPLLFALSLIVGWYTRNQMFRLAGDFSLAMEGQELARRELDVQNWVQSNLARLTASTRDEPGLRVLGEKFLEIICEATGAALGTFYCLNEVEHRWVCYARRGLTGDVTPSFAEDESLVGQAAKSKSLTQLRALPHNYFLIHSGTGKAQSNEVVLISCHHDGETHGVVELGFLVSPLDRDLRLMRAAGESMGIALAVTRKRLLQRELLNESKRQGEALQAQQEELRVTNEELASRSAALRLAHAQLEERKEELEASNADLLQQRDALSAVREDLAARAVELRRANRYKSEFLASMSHELRTPLNSCLILSKALAENKSANLTEEQVKFAETIHASGSDLLELINAVLDLSKIEAGAVDLAYEELSLQALVRPVVRIVEPIAADRGLAFVVQMPEANTVIETDPVRVQQVLKNLLSNACKFTFKGEVRLDIHVHEDMVSFRVADSGIGIPEEHLAHIFEAFRQADGTTSRKFGGTGLGLTISRDLASRLGGNIEVHSQVDVGSEFVLTIPLRQSGACVTNDSRVQLLATSSLPPREAGRRVLVMPGAHGVDGELESAIASAGLEAAQVSNDAEAIQRLKNERLLAVIACEEESVNSLSSVATAEGPSLPYLIIYTGQALTPTQESALGRSSHAVILKGEKSLERLRDELTALSQLGNPPCEVNSERNSAWQPQTANVSLKGRRVLLVEDDVRNVYALTSILEKEGIVVDVARNGKDALSKLGTASSVDMVLMDIMMPEMNGLEATRAIRDSKLPWHSVPIIALTAKAMRDDRKACLEAGANDYVTKPVDVERLVSLMKSWLERG